MEWLSVARSLPEGGLPFAGAPADWTEDQRRLFALWQELRSVWQAAAFKNIDLPDARVYRTYRSWRRWADWLQAQERQDPRKGGRAGSGWILKR